MFQLLTPEQIRAAFDARGAEIEHATVSTRPVPGHPSQFRAIATSWCTIGQIATLVSTRDVTPNA
jgi:hypothetical protein